MAPSSDAKIYKKPETVSQSLTSRSLSGMIYGRSLKFIKAPANTTGHLITWSLSSTTFKNIGHLPNQDEEDFSWRHSSTSTAAEPRRDLQDQRQFSSADQPMNDVVSMEDGEVQPSLKREGPDARTVVLCVREKEDAPWLRRVRCSVLQCMFHAKCNGRTQKYQDGLSNQFAWYTSLGREPLDRKVDGWSFYAPETVRHPPEQKTSVPHAASQDAVLHVDLRTPEVWRVSRCWTLWHLWVWRLQDMVSGGGSGPARSSTVCAGKGIPQNPPRCLRSWMHGGFVAGRSSVDGSKKVKSRFCARGCLDRQKDLLTTRALQQHALASGCFSPLQQFFTLEVESWDIASASGRGWVSIKSTWCWWNWAWILRFGPSWSCDRWTFGTISQQPRMNTQYALLCLKPVHGLNDAPLAWQLSLQEYLREIEGSPSVMAGDGNNPAQRVHSRSLHMSRQRHGHCSTSDVGGHSVYATFVKKFGKVSRQRIPFEHCGAKYEKMPGGYRMTQSDFCAKMTPAKIADGRKDKDKSTKEERTSFRLILGALLWLIATRLESWPHRCLPTCNSCH